MRTKNKKSVFFTEEHLRSIIKGNNQSSDVGIDYVIQTILNNQEELKISHV